MSEYRRHPWHDTTGPDRHDPRPGAHAPLVLDEATCFAYRRRAGRRMQTAIYRTECPREAARQFADAVAVRDEFDA